MKRFLAHLFLVGAATATAVAANWPAWRGPTGDGIATETNLPLRWSTNENVCWRAPLPDRGNSTPVIWDDRVFVTQAIEKEGRRLLLCFDKASGKLLWESGVTYTDKEPTHETNPYCSASPATDGERVIASFGSAGLCAYDFAGKELWRRDLGKQHHIWGNAASPVIHGGLCILNVGPGERTFLVALDKRTGEEKWRVDEPGGHFGQGKPGDDNRNIWIGSWSTPIIIAEAGQPRLIMSFPRRVAALDPASGKEIWTCRGLNPLVYTSPLHADGIVVAMGGFNGSAFAVKTGGAGDVTEMHRLWHHPKTKQRIGSGVISRGHIYVSSDPGVAECFDLRTGKLIWEERLKGTASANTSWSSMVLAGDRLYVSNHGGDTFVVAASPTFTAMATNSLGEKIESSIAISDQQLFIRTYKSLWCIGNPSK
ncbi:MAG: PQQ-like beta-propeller repeat protein [Verrucomicrobia subdivision 3 bacterium]|nr:PQQ-like beta-propeller repeat protein [Limisphaerales bacterium]